MKSRQCTSNSQGHQCILDIGHPGGHDYNGPLSPVRSPPTGTDAHERMMRERERRSHLIARMAGNIAAGIAPEYGRGASSGDEHVQRDIASRAVRIAVLILEEIDNHNKEKSQ